MRYAHPAHPGIGVRLSYGLNLVPSRDAAGVLAALRTIALPLRARLAPDAEAFGVGAWIPARAAAEFLSEERRLAELAELCAENGLDPCTFNAFPQGDFHGPGLKERVFVPTWKDPARLAFTLDVARLAVHLRARRGGSREGAHLSISTHAGMLAAHLGAGDREALAEGFLAAASALAELEARSGERVVLSLEPEPRSSANDTRELAPWLAFVRSRARGTREAAAWRHLGACLDTCHAAVEFEDPAEAFARATASDNPLGKLQFSSALALREPDRHPEGRRQLLALAEPVYLHQVTGRRGPVLLRVLDLPELESRADEWAGCETWRCHFHVPVDLDVFGGEGGLATTREEADRLLGVALASPERWGTRELHVEVETYTWNLLRPAQTGSESVLEGLGRELAHVDRRLRAAGWAPVR